MSVDNVIDIARGATIITLQLALPLLLFGLVVGVIVSILQAVTSIQEMTLTFVPKILAVILALVIFGPWMLQNIVAYTSRLFINLPFYVR